MQVVVDMTHAKAAMEVLRRRNVGAGLTHLVVRAAALALARNPRIYRMVCGYGRLTTGQVDIGLSTGEESVNVPVVLRAVERAPLDALPAAIEQAITVARAREDRIRRSAWLAPFGFVRRWLLRSWYRAFASRRRLAGSFEVVCHEGADVVAPLRFYTDAVLSAGRMRDVVVDVDGRLAIRPTVCLSLCVDHVAMDGMRGAALINAVREILESDELLLEAAGEGGQSP
jgi:pyruvate/2-oxoglutarate dehydrogenase complex dihydrolipoamide acyltransferase (E2) component